MEAAGIKHRSEIDPLYAMADTTPAEFGAAIDEAKAEGNLSRANVVRYGAAPGQSSEVPPPRS